MKVLVVIDMQNDFIDGALGTPEAVGIVPGVAEKIRTWDGPVYATQDTHFADYLETQEGRILPVPHCIQGTAGWRIVPAVHSALAERAGVEMEESRLLTMANAWEVRHGGFSGRTAQQFIHYLQGGGEDA